MSQTLPLTARPEAPTSAQVTSPRLPDLVLDTLADTVAALTALVQAQRAKLLLGPAWHGLAAPLRQAGLEITTVTQHGLHPETAPRFPLPRPLPGPEGQPTDLVDLALDLCAGDACARLDLTAVPVGWSSRSCLAGITPLAHVLLRQLVALRAGAGLLAPAMLGLLERLREYDDAAASHLVTGFLRLMAAQTPSQVEVTALRIAGLSDMPAAYRNKTEVRLNGVALELLDALSLTPDTSSGDAAQSVTSVMQSPPPRPALGLMPFARLHLLERNYAVAEDDETHLLWFRPMDGGVQADWTLLENRTVDGWTHVAAEILGKTHDIHRAFAMMHVIRRRDIATEEVAEIYDLHGLIWWLRDGEAGPEARLDGGPWLPYPAADHHQGKSRAVEALFHLMPDLSDLLGHKAQDWANRMAQTVQVAPVLMQAAE